MTNTKKLCLFLSILTISLFYKIEITKADITSSINFNYGTGDRTIYQEIQQYVENNNTNNYDYLIGKTGSRYYIFLQKNDATRKIDKIYISSWEKKDTSTQYRIGQALVFHTTSNMPNGYYVDRITQSDWVNNTSAKTTFINNMINALRGTGLTSGIPSYLGGIYYKDNTPELEYINNGIEFYYSSIPLYMINKKSFKSSLNNTVRFPENGSEATNDSIETICNNNDFTISYDQNLTINYNNLQMECGQEYPTVSNQYSNEYTIDIKNDFEKQIQSIDIYVDSETYTTYDRKYKLEFEYKEGFTNTYLVKAYKFYGKKCNINNNNQNNKTCWWEEIQQDNSNPIIYVDNDSETYTQDTYTYELELIYDMTGQDYKEIKLAIVNDSKNFDFTIKSTTDNDIDYELNTIYYDYCREITTINKSIAGILVNQKPTIKNDIMYRFYTKVNGNEATDTGQISYYYYNKKWNQIQDKWVAYDNYIYYKEPRLLGYIYNWILTGTIEMGENKEETLFIFMSYTNDNGRNDIYKNYFNTQVYYTITDNMNKININYTGTGGNIQQNIEVDIQATYIAEEQDYLLSGTFTYLSEIIEEYTQYKNEWINLFDNIYQPMPRIIKQIAIFLYSMLWIFGIYKITKY